MSHPLERTYFAPYTCVDESIKKAKCINAALKTLSTEKSLYSLGHILIEYGWRISTSRLNSIKKELGLTKKSPKPSWNYTKFQVLLRHWTEKSPSRNWCLWVEWRWLDEEHTRATVSYKFWTRWNAAYAPCDLLP